MTVGWIRPLRWDQDGDDLDDTFEELAQLLDACDELAAIDFCSACEGRPQVA